VQKKESVAEKPENWNYFHVLTKQMPRWRLVAGLRQKPFRERERGELPGLDGFQNRFRVMEKSPRRITRRGR